MSSEFNVVMNLVTKLICSWIKYCVKNKSLYSGEQVIRSFHSSSLSVENAGSASAQKQTCVTAAGKKCKQLFTLYVTLDHKTNLK